MSYVDDFDQRLARFRAHQRRETARVRALTHAAIAIGFLIVVLLSPR